MIWGERVTGNSQVTAQLYKSPLTKKNYIWSVRVEISFSHQILIILYIKRGLIKISQLNWPLKTPCSARKPGLPLIALKIHSSLVWYAKCQSSLTLHCWLCIVQVQLKLLLQQLALPEAETFLVRGKQSGQFHKVEGKQDLLRWEQQSCLHTQ